MASACAVVRREEGGDDGGVPPVAVTHDADAGVLPADVLYEIFLRVPADALCRLRLVCRAWRSLTSDRLFAAAHSSRHPLLAGLLDGGREIHAVDVASGAVLRRIRLPKPTESRPLITTHRDLVCASSETSGEARVVNLSTGEVTVLPAATDYDDGEPAAAYILGHVPSTDEYKVLRINLGAHRRTIRFINTCHVITLAAGGGGDPPRWRARPVCPLSVVGVVPSMCRTTVVDGVAYFMVNGKALMDLGPDCVASFDMASEEWRPMPFQGPVSSHRSRAGKRLPPVHHLYLFRLAVFSDRLVVLHRNIEEESTDFWFLEGMADDNKQASWTKRYSMPWCPRGDRWEYPLAVSDDGSRILVWMEVSRILRAYDPETTTSVALSSVKDYSAVAMHHGSLLYPGL